MFNKNTRIALFFICAAIFAVISLWFIYNKLTSELRFTFLNEVAKHILQLVVIVIVGGWVKYSYDSLVQNNKVDEDSRKEKEAENRTAIYFSQLNNAVKLLFSGTCENEKIAITILTELGRDYPHRWQEIINKICEYLRTTFNKKKEVDTNRRAVLEYCIRCLANLPRYDDNNHPLNIDINQIKIQGIDLTCINFKDITMWGCFLIDVNISKSSFENADLSGTIFQNCGMELCNFKNSVLAMSFLDNNQKTAFLHTRLWGHNLHEALIYSCDLEDFECLDQRHLVPFVQSGNLNIFRGVVG